MKRTTGAPGVAGPFLTTILILSSALASGASVPAGHAPPGSEGPAQVVPRAETAQAQLELASSLRSAMRGKDGAEREAARLAAVSAYAAVRAYFPDDPTSCAEASFRAGELLRAGGLAERAIAEFHAVWERGAGSPYRVRAGLEIGHLHRRAGRRAEALAAYENVLADAGAVPEERDEASYWTGRVHEEAGRLEAARRAWQRVADSAEDPLDRIRAWDRIGLSFVASGDLEAAAGALERCRESLSDVAAEETRLGRRVRAALSTMRVQDDLQRAVQERERSRSETERDDSSGSGSVEKKTSSLFLPTARVR